MATEREQVEAAIAALEGQRGLLGDAVVDLAVAPLRAKLAALAAPRVEPPAQTLKQVTILFLDVVGSTTLSQQLDPEDIHALLDGTLARCAAIVEAHEGKVLQYAGDSLLAVFGSDQAREDDAERAVRAGLGLLDEGGRQGDAVRTRHRHDGYNVRVGIHTGSVLLGGGVDAEGSIRGMPVNIAARMEQAAPPGALRISRDTFRQVRGLFDVEEQPPLEVKGLDEPMVTYLVQRARARAFGVLGRGIGQADGPSTELVGRDEEIATVMIAMEQARSRRALRMVTVVADAGLGKSRFLLEVEKRLAEDPLPIRLFHGRAQRHGMNVPYGVVRDMLAWHCDILDSDDAETACAKLTNSFGLALGDRAAEQSALVGQLIGLDFSNDPHIAGITQDGRQIRARAFHAIGQYLRLQCQDGALVVVLLDDLHWADDGSLDLIEQLAATCRDLPVVLGCFARPALLERREQWGDHPGHAFRIVLKPLARESSEQLLGALLARLSDPPPELRALILRNAEGNPFHMEELLSMLIDDGVIVTSPDGWVVDRKRLSQAKVPPTLIAVLQARLDALPPHEKRSLQQDSVIGHVFWDAALRDIAPESVESLAALVRRELIDAQDVSAFAGIGEYAFKHHLLHQATYDTVLKAQRREIHQRTAEWLVAQTGERIGEHLGLIADHYERAGDAVHAGAFLSRAAEAAYRAAAFAASLDYVDRALAMVGDDEFRVRFDLQDLRLNVLNSLGRRSELPADTDRLERYAEALDCAGCDARVARWRALIAVIGGDYAVAIAEADRAEELATRPEDALTALSALLDKAQALIYRSDDVAAEACLLYALALARTREAPAYECNALNRLNAIAIDRGDYASARAHLVAAIAVAKATGNRRFEGGLLGNLGALEARIGHHDEGRRQLEAGLAISREIGDRGSEPYDLLALASISQQQGDAANAVAMADEAVRIARDVTDRGCEADALLVLGHCHVDLGNFADAGQCFDAFDTWFGQTSSDLSASRAAPARAEMIFAQGRIDEARAIIESIVEWLDRGSTNVGKEGLARCMACHRVLSAMSHERAHEFLDRAHDLLKSQAERLADADREAYLKNVGLHRAIVEAYEARGPRPGA